MATFFKKTIVVADDNTPKIVVAGSGMINGGRILHYLKRNLYKEENTVLICEYQAIDTRGRSLLEGEPDSAQALRVKSSARS